MKHFFWLPIFLALSCFAAGCGKDEGSNSSCSKNVAITAVQPNTNPVGYEVLIKTSSFTSAAKVVFASVTATSRPGGQAGDIIAKVPAGVVGNVEITVEEGDCLARSGGFIASGALPTGVQPSLPNIIVPITTTPPPAGSIGNQWLNAAATLDISNNPEQSIILAEGIINGSIINFDESNSFEINKSVTNKVSGFANISTNQVLIIIDRTANGGSIEHFDGQFIVVPNSLPSTAILAMLLVSRETGRQLLIYRN